MSVAPLTPTYHLRSPTGRYSISVSSPRETCRYAASHLPLGVTSEGREAIILSRVSRKFLVPLLGTLSAKIGQLPTTFYIYFLVLLVYLSFFIFVSYIKNYKKNCHTCCYYGSTENTKLCDFTSLNNKDFICTPIATPATSATTYEIKPALLNLVMKEQLFGAGDAAALHLNNFVELCDMQKYKEVEGNVVKLKLFPFSLRGDAKIWFQSLPRNSIDCWDKCKDAFIGKYYPPAKIIQLRSNIMNFKQLDNEHVAQAWERMKSLVKKFPTHGLTTWMVSQTFYAGLNFTSRNLLDLAAGGTFMSTTLGAATKLLDEMMTNYSQWHTEHYPQGRNVTFVAEY